MTVLERFPVSCPHCNRHGKVKNEFNGRKVQCPACKKSFTARHKVSEHLNKPDVALEASSKSTTEKSGDILCANCGVQAEADVITCMNCGAVLPCDIQTKVASSDRPSASVKDKAHKSVLPTSATTSASKLHHGRGGATERIGGYALVMAGVRAKVEQTKPLFGKPYLKLGQCHALWGYFFQLVGYWERGTLHT